MQCADFQANVATRASDTKDVCNEGIKGEDQDMGKEKVRVFVYT